MSKTKQGAIISVKLNGVKVAFASGFNVNHNNELQDIDVLDDIVVAEHAEISHKVSFSINTFKVDENAAALFGLDPANIDDLSNQPELTFEAFNRKDNKVEYVVTGCKFEGGTGQVDARGVWSGTWNFKGRRGTGI